MVEVTEAMLDAGQAAWLGLLRPSGDALAAAYRAMAAASTPVEEGEVEQIIAAVMSFVSVVDGATLLDVTGVRIALAATRQP